jgi:hypothetical protein
VRDEDLGLLDHRAPLGDRQPHRRVDTGMFVAQRRELRSGAGAPALGVGSPMPATAA